MAFSQQEENILQQLIEAFQNGKTIADLPTAEGSNPFNMSVGVVDTDGETKRAALTTMLPYLEARCAYGIEFDTTTSSPTCTRLGNMSLHRSLPIHNRMRGCLLNDDGEVVEYLPPTDWTTAVRDGSRGQVMVEIPMHYRRFITEGTKRRVMLSEYPLPQYHRVPKIYVSAYEASLQRSTNKLSSVVNTSADYRGGDNRASWDGTYRSLLGRCVSYQDRANLRTFARNRKANSTEWNMYTYDAHKTLTWLFVVEYATLNSQLAFNPQLTADGYKQGGLGKGPVQFSPGVGNSYDNLINWNNFNPFIPCGYTDIFGNGTGTLDYICENVILNPERERGEWVVPAIRYRGIENIFGHLKKEQDGLIGYYIPEGSGGDGKNHIYYCSDPALYSDTDISGYVLIGQYGDFMDRFIKEIAFGENGDLYAISSGGSTSTYFCDYGGYYKQEGIGRVIIGSAFPIGEFYGGLFCFYNSSSSSSLNNTRLCFIPKII